MKKRALVKNTGKILDIDSSNSSYSFEYNMPIGFEFSDESYGDISFIDFGKISLETESTKAESFILSDGKTYSKDDLVIGIDEIRDWKIKHNLEID